jgi:hypothetical protein
MAATATFTGAYTRPLTPLQWSGQPDQPFAHWPALANVQSSACICCQRPNSIAAHTNFPSPISMLQSLRGDDAHPITFASLGIGFEIPCSPFCGWLPPTLCFLRALGHASFLILRQPRSSSPQPVYKAQSSPVESRERKVAIRIFLATL